MMKMKMMMMMSLRPRSTPRLLLFVAAAVWLDGAAAFAQTPRMPAMPALPSLPSLPGAPSLPPSTMSAMTLGGIASNLGGLNPTSALGSVTACPVTGASVAPNASGPLPSTLSIVFATPAPAVLTPQTLSSSAVAGPLVVAPLAAPSITPAFGTATLSGACAPATLADTSTSTPSVPLIESAYSNAGTPPQSAEISGGGLSPLIEVPPPVLFSSGGTVTNSSGVVAPGQ
jgi:hypothetical protein